uniref:Uncharacterized protein n=1 Tax=Clastoptera arizonana TaxID=38151 RepID=A0A1B6C4K8_9HEMI
MLIKTYVVWFYFYLFYILFGFSVCCKHIDYELESSKYIHNRLINLGITIKDRLLDPRTDKDESLMLKLYQYHNLLLEIYEFLRRKDVVEHSKGVKIYKTLIKENGFPPFINMVIDYDYIRNFHNWREEIEMVNIKSYIKEIQKIWKKIQSISKGEDVKESIYYDFSSENENLL